MNTQHCIEPERVTKWARFLGIVIDLHDTSGRNNEIAGLITRELRSRMLGGHVVCACGNGPDPAESPNDGLYIDNDGAIRRICGRCWLRETMTTKRKPDMNDNAEHLATIQHLTEQLAAYQDAVRDAVQVLGHEGCEPVDLRDALGEIERLLAGQSSCERSDLQGLAEDVRAVLWHRDRAVSLLESARAQATRNAVARDSARAFAASLGNGSVNCMIGLCWIARIEGDAAIGDWLLTQAAKYVDPMHSYVALCNLYKLRKDIPGWDDYVADARRRLGEPLAADLDAALAEQD